MTVDNTPAQKPGKATSRVDSFRYAFAGWRHAWRTQPNLWIHAVFSFAVLVVGLWLRLKPLEWAVIALTAGMVWVAEFTNTALEALVDLASPQYHPLAKVGKDVAAAAVLTGALTAVTVGLLILGPPLVERLRLMVDSVLRSS